MFKKQKSELRVAYDAAMDGYQAFLREFVPRHVAEHGSPPTVDQRVCEYARSLGWVGTYSFGGLSDEPRSGEYATHHEAIVNSIARDRTQWVLESDQTLQRLENRRRQVSDNLEEFYVVVASLVMRSPGRLIAAIPGFFGAKVGQYTRKANTSEWELSATAALFSSGSEVGNPKLAEDYNVWSMPKWATDAGTTPLFWAMQFSPWSFSNRREFARNIIGAKNAPRVLEEFVQYKVNYEVNLVETRLRTLGRQFGFSTEEEWHERLTNQPWNRSGLGNKVNLENEKAKSETTDTALQALYQPHTVVGTPRMSPVESRLAEVTELLSQGLIDQDEHDALRRKILGI